MTGDQLAAVVGLSAGAGSMVGWAALLAGAGVAWFLGCVIGWAWVWRGRGGSFTWRIVLGPWAYDRWFHEVNDRW